MDIHLPYSIGYKVYYISLADKIKEVIIRGIRIYQNCILYDVYNKEEDDYFVLESDNIAVQFFILASALTYHNIYKNETRIGALEEEIEKLKGEEKNNERN